MATIVITGASDGIGAAAARALIADHTVVIVGRSPTKTQSVARELGVEHHVCDFARLDQVRALAATLADAHPSIDVLANNAGGILAERQVTEDGFEATLQINHLAPALLTTLLLPNLRAGAGTVIMTASDASRVGRLDLADLAMTRGWSSMRAYGTAKLANICYARGLQRAEGGTGINAASFHPGVVASSFGSGGGPKVVGWFYKSWLARQLLLSNDQGADTLVWLARGRAGVDWTPGGYFIKRHEVDPPPQAHDDALVGRFYDATILLNRGALQAISVQRR